MLFSEGYSCPNAGVGIPLFLLVGITTERGMTMLKNVSWRQMFLILGCLIALRIMLEYI